jgi:hypothetical protein
MEPEGSILLLDHVLSQFSTVHIITIYFHKVHFNSILPSMPWSHKWSLFRAFLWKMLYSFLVSPTKTTSHPSHPNLIRQRKQNCGTPQYAVFSIILFFISLRYNYSVLSTPICIMFNYLNSLYCKVKWCFLLLNLKERITWGKFFTITTEGSLLKACNKSMLNSYTTNKEIPVSTKHAVESKSNVLHIKVPPHLLCNFYGMDPFKFPLLRFSQVWCWNSVSPHQ